MPPTSGQNCEDCGQDIKLSIILYPCRALTLLF